MRFLSLNFSRDLEGKTPKSKEKKKKEVSPVSVGVVLEALEDPADLVPHVVQGRVREARGDDDGVVVEPFVCLFVRFFEEESERELKNFALPLLSCASEGKKNEKPPSLSPRVVLLVQDRDQVQVVPVRVPARLVVQRRDHHDARLLLDADGDGGAGKAAAVWVVGVGEKGAEGVSK